MKNRYNHKQLEIHISQLVCLYYLYVYFNYLKLLSSFNFALNGQVVRLFDIKFSQGLYTGISGSAYIDSKANVGDEIEF
ncbi:hypothetical protein, partial [Francisella philomiragia]